MTQHWTDDYGKPLIGLGMQNELNISTLSMFLFQSNSNPDHTSTFSGLTEATFSGYARIALITSWSPVGIDGSFNYVTQAASAYIFTATGPSPANDIYGYGIVDGSNNLILAERNPAGPVTIDASGLAYTVIFKLFCNNNPAP